MSELEKMYVDFRQEIDSYCAESIVKNLDTRPVIYEGKVVGFLILDDDYVDSFYIMPEYRRKGIGKRFITEQYLKDKGNWYDLRIVRDNHVAFVFWNDVFKLKLIEYNFCDEHWEILGLRQRG